ncbi:MAG: hydrogenase maturation protease [Acidobacteriia bacterium]|nr:hydrogenase maturation protease [Terriglobia bacterium]
MAASNASEAGVRVLGLGNELLADDAFGILAARAVRRRFGRAAEVVCSSAAGFHLIDHVLNIKRLLVIDTVAVANAIPGTIHVFRGADPRPATLPHFVGLFDVLDLARRLGLPVPDEVLIVGVEAADCTTVGGAMHPEVRAAIPKAVEIAGSFLRGGAE